MSAKPRLYEYRGEFLSAKEIAERTGTPLTRIKARLSLGKTGENLTAPRMDPSLSASIAARAGAARRDEQKELLESIGLSERMSFEECGNLLGISATTVMNIERSIFSKIRNALEARGIGRDELFG